MKKWMLVAAAALFTVSLQVPVFVHADGSDQGKMGPKHMDEGERLDHMTKHLKLTPDQQTKVKAALDARHEKMKSLRDTFMQGMKGANDEFDSSVLAVLNDDQKKQFNEMKEKREARIKNWKDKHSEKDGDEK